MPRPHLRLARAGSAGGTAPATSAAVGGEFPATLWTVRPIVVVAHGQMRQPEGPHPGDRFGCMDNSIDSGVDTSRPASLLRPPSVPADLESLRALQLERLQWSLRHAYENVPHYRRAFDEAGVTAGRPARARRPGALPVHHQGRPARQLPLRHVRGAAREGLAHPRLQRHHRPAHGGRLHQGRHRHLGRGDGALDRGGGRPGRGHGARRLRLWPVHRRHRRALRRRAPRLHGRPGLRRHDRAPGPAHRGLPARGSSWSPRPTSWRSSTRWRPRASTPGRPPSRSASSAPSPGPSRCARRSSGAPTSGRSTSTASPR